MNHARAAGFSIVELMVAMAVSSIVLLALSSIFVASSQSQTTQGALSEIHETGRFAVDQIAYHLRMAGSRRANWTLGAVPGALAATDGPSDQLTVIYEDTVDCNLAPAVGGFVTNVFAVVGDTLQCNGVDLIDGVVELQVFLGEDTDGDRVANRLVPPNSAGLQLNRVVSINVNLLVASLRDRVAVNDTVLRNPFWNTTPASGDTRVWREYSTTVTLRNSIL